MSRVAPAATADRGEPGARATSGSVLGGASTRWTEGRPGVGPTYLNALAAAAVALTAAAPSYADSQLAASAGLNPAQAAGLMLTEIAQAKFNRDARGDDRHVIVVHGVASPESRAQLAANAGVSPVEAQGLSLSEIAAAKFNRESAGGDQQRVVRGDVTKVARSVADNSAWVQLIAGAGLTTDEAAGLSLSEIAKVKFDRESDDN